MCEKCNGWSNYETWNINLWLTNEEGTDSMMNKWAQECYDDAKKSSYFSRKEEAVFVLSDKIKEFIEENNPLADISSMYSDLLGAAISSADFLEIANGFMENVDEEVEEAEEKE